MKLSQSFSQFHPLLKLLYALCMYVGFFIIGTIVSASMMFLVNDSNYAFWLTQSLSSVIAFLLPSLWLAHLDGQKNLKGYLQWNKAEIKMSLMFVFLFLSTFAVIDSLSVINYRIADGILTEDSFLRRIYDGSNTLIMQMTLNTSLVYLFFNVLVIAAIAAICEEVMFRGVIANMLHKSGWNIHSSVWVSAVLFSLIHMDVFGFLPRVFIGAVLGYCFFYTKSIWIPILLHFINNFTIVFVYFLFEKNILTDTEIISTEKTNFMSLASIIASVVLVICTFVFIKRHYKQNNEGQTFYK